SSLAYGQRPASLTRAAARRALAVATCGASPTTSRVGHGKEYPFRRRLSRLSNPAPAASVASTVASPSSWGEVRPGYSCGFLQIREAILLPRHAVTRGGPVPQLIRSGRWALAVWLLLIAGSSPKGGVI